MGKYDYWYKRSPASNGGGDGAVGGEGGAPLEFPRRSAPVCMDFLYFSMVVGMTSQTSDVTTATTRMRRLVMAHGIVAFVFNTTLLALTGNIAASMLG